MRRLFRIGALCVMALGAWQASAMPLGYRLSCQARAAVRQAKPKLVGTGKVTVPKTWKVGQKVTWKATADKGSVFARWEGPLVDSLNLTKNERRNPSLAFAVPEGFDTNQIKAVFIPIDDDGLYSLGITQTEFDLKETVSGVCVTDDSQSYVTATASGLPTGLKFDAKKMKITGTPTKSGVYWVQIKAKNASGYQWAENVRVTVLGGGTEAKEPKLTRTAHHPLTVICANEGGTVSGAGVYAEGKKVSVKATPAKGYVFAGWHETANSEKGTVNGVDGADYRSASLKVTVPETRYVFALFATKEDDADSLKVAVEDVTTEKDGTIALDLGACVASLSLPKLAVSGLPSGVKYDAKTLKLTGKATKPGVYTVTVKATNASVTRATDATTATFKITVPNFECAALPMLKPETDAYGIVRSGVKFDDALVDCSPADGWTVKVAGLPSGLKWDAKTGKIVGVPTAKVGSYTVTFTASKKGEKNQVATITLNVKALPAWAVGNFEGFVSLNENNGGLATMSVTAAGKISGKISYGGTNWTFKADSFAVASETVGYTNLAIRTVATAGKATLELSLNMVDFIVDSLPSSTTSFAEGYFGEIYTMMYRLPWKDKGDVGAAALIASYAGAYSCKVPYGEDAGDVTFILDEKGMVKGTVILPDGAKTRKATFSCNVLPNYDSLSVVIALPPDAKKGYPAVFKVVNLVNHSGEGADDLAFRDPGVVAAVAELTAESGATGTVSVNPKYGQVAPGKDVTLTAKAAKGSVFHRWEITGVDTEGIDLSSSTLKIKMTDTGDVFAKAVFVTAEEDAASIALSVDALGGEISPEAFISVTNTCGVALKWSVAADALSKPVVAVTGLPSGLKFTAKDIMKKGSKTEIDIPANTIYGAPTAESKLNAKTGLRKPSAVKFTVTTAGKSKRVYSVDMTVLPLPDWAVGTFNGGGDLGQVSLTVAKTGKLSGKYLSEGLTWTLAADSFDSIDESGEVYRATLIGKSGKLVMTNEIGVAGNAIGGYAESVDYIAYQNNWKLEPWKTVGKPFAKAAALEYEDSASLAGVEAPGVLSLKFAASGAVTVKGSFVTGVNERTGKDILYTASGSAVLAPQSEPDEIGAFDAVVFVYLPPKAGKFDGYVRCIDVRWTGDGWIKQ